VQDVSFISVHRRLAADTVKRFTLLWNCSTMHFRSTCYFVRSEVYKFRF